jgi:hypothetical protein
VQIAGSVSDGKFANNPKENYLKTTIWQAGTKNTPVLTGVFLFSQEHKREKERKEIALLFTADSFSSFSLLSSSLVY